MRHELIFFRSFVGEEQTNRATPLGAPNQSPYVLAYVILIEQRVQPNSPYRFDFSLLETLELSRLISFQSGVSCCCCS